MWSLLPQDIKNKILYQLDAKDLDNYEKTSKQSKLSTWFWYDYCRQHYPKLNLKYYDIPDYWNNLYSILSRKRCVDDGVRLIRMAEKYPYNENSSILLDLVLKHYSMIYKRIDDGYIFVLINTEALNSFRSSIDTDCCGGCMSEARHEWERHKRNCHSIRFNITKTRIIQYLISDSDNEYSEE